MGNKGKLRKALEHIRDYEKVPGEVAYDRFAYIRLSEYYKAAARVGLGEINSTDEHEYDESKYD